MNLLYIKLDDQFQVNLCLEVMKIAKEQGLFEVFVKLGTGIASIMILILVTHYIIGLLSGAKFELKMLKPFLIFFIVTNFYFVAKPVLIFSTSLTGSCMSSLSVQNKKMIGSISLRDVFLKNTEWGKDVNSNNPQLDENEDNLQPNDNTTNSNNDKSWLMNKVNSILKYLWNILLNMFGVMKLVSGSVANIGMYALMAVLWFIAEAIASALSILGALMTIIIVAFGPITFSFAIFPGRMETVKTWFFRLCQFALYAPIASLISSVTIAIGVHLFGDFSFATNQIFTALMIAELVALTAIPSIASMIIEGASGALSLSQGLQTIGTTVAGASKTLMIAKKGFDKLKQVATGSSANMGGGSAGSSTGSPTGMNNSGVKP